VTSLRIQGEVQTRDKGIGKPVTLGEQRRSDDRARGLNNGIFQVNGDFP